jgi:hypothetical protein
MGIAFLPIDINVQLPDEQKLHAYCEQHKIVTTKDDSHSWWWNVIPVLVRGPIDTPEQLEDILANRYNAGVGTPRYVNNIDKEFPEIPYMLEQLPFKELTVVAMLEQKEAVDYHTDGYNNDYLFNDPTELAFELEPKRYNILLTKHSYQNCFFVADKPGGNKVYPAITKERPCHIIADRYYAHGADYRGPGKIMLAVIGGILDREKHLALIDKHKQDAIIFPDPL